ncbi:Tar ligand binding domain-containing protein, partial [Salmonella enterica subsp. enterica serovar Montevideo]|nr:Tar ligand binding domain-containing protein [Salmonella enterica subsp. enterica serovar Montevideo]
QANNDAGFNTFFKRGWKRFYLKWYSDAHPSAETLCPITTKLVITGVIATLGIFSALLLVTGILFYSAVSSDRLNFQNASALSY